MAAMSSQGKEVYMVGRRESDEKIGRAVLERGKRRS